MPDIIVPKSLPAIALLMPSLTVTPKETFFEPISSTFFWKYSLSASISALKAGSFTKSSPNTFLPFLFNWSIAWFHSYSTLSLPSNNFTCHSFPRVGSSLSSCSCKFLIMASVFDLSKPEYVPSALTV